jgi:hypothetical protein
MTQYVSHNLRRQVMERANFICEYCLLHDDESHFGGELDHIISLKHDGPTELENLAYACLRCNRHKGTDLGSINWQTRQLVRFFNPRTDRWQEHFELRSAEIVPLTEIGEATVRILGFNSPKRLKERALLIKVGLYPSAEAMEVMSKTD